MGWVVAWRESIEGGGSLFLFPPLCVYICVHIHCVYTHVCTHACICLCVDNMHRVVLSDPHLGVDLCNCVCVHVCVYILYVHSSVYTCMHVFMCV